MSQDPFFAEEDELGLLGCILTGDPDVATDALASIKLDWIVTDTVRDSLEVIRSMESCSTVTIQSLGKEWKKRSTSPMPFDAWNRAMEVCPSSANIPLYIQAISDAFHRRQLRAAGDRLVRESAVSTLPVDQIVANAESGLTIDASRETLTNAKQVAVSFVDQMQERFARKGTLSGISTGLHKLDQMTDGLQFREMAVLAARPSIGKTAIAISIAIHAAVESLVPTLFVSLEMSKEAIFRRAVSALGHIPMKDLKSGNLSEQDMRSMTGASARLSKSPIWYIDGPSSQSILSIQAAVKRAVRKHGVKLVVVDYLQKIKCSEKSEKRTYEVAEVSGKLKDIATQTGVAVLCLAQLNRESEKDKGRLPRLTDLADSGQIERDADLVMLLDRDRKQPSGEAQIVVAKQRDGECGIVKLHYEGQFCRFSEYSIDH